MGGSDLTELILKQIAFSSLKYPDAAAAHKSRGVLAKHFAATTCFDTNHSD